MARKPYAHTERSARVKCVECSRGLKLNVIERKEKTPDRCYSHWQAKQARRRNRA